MNEMYLRTSMVYTVADYPLYQRRPPLELLIKMRKLLLSFVVAVCSSFLAPYVYIYCIGDTLNHRHKEQI